jgi:predicted ATPase
MAQAASAKRASSVPSADEAQQGITAITVQGYKSIDDEVTVSIAPLTILAGANSSGKSSLMQPLLLMKQTLEAPYDPGALLLNGPNLKFTSAEQLFTRRNSRETTKKFKVGIEIYEGKNIACTFQKVLKNSIDLSLTEYRFSGNILQLYPSVSSEELLLELERIYQDTYSLFSENLDASSHLKISKQRCFFRIVLDYCGFELDLRFPPFFENSSVLFQDDIEEILHIAGLRGNPERTYRTTAVGQYFPGLFENYVASIIRHWQLTKDNRIGGIEAALRLLGLTSKIDADQIDDTQVELRVSRLPCNSKSKVTSKDMVSIADVGFGISQVLPVLVALLAARPGQLVYIEQPEIHLHPRAQVAIAEIFADAANRGVRVVVETHSELFLMSVQSLVAEGKLAPDKVKLHWFTRQENGNTKITSADLDESGSFGEDWPEDFAEVSLSIQNRYLSAAEAKLWRS